MWIDDGQPGIRWLENEDDAACLTRYLRKDQRLGRPQWWIVNVRSMSPGARNALLDQLVIPGQTIQRFRWRDARALSRRSTPTQITRRAKKSQALGAALWMLLMLPWMLVVGAISTLGRLIGRGPRRYLLHAPAKPPPMNPPYGGVREPLTPLPTSGPSALMAEDPALGH